MLSFRNKTIIAKKGCRISNEIKDEILNKIKDKELSVSEAANHCGIHTGTIYNQLGTKAKGVVSILEHNKLKKKNEQLKQII